MEFMEGGTLTEAIKGHGAFHEKQAAYVAQEMLKGISYLHKLGFVHRDLKSANVSFFNVKAYLSVYSDSLQIGYDDDSR